MPSRPENVAQEIIDAQEAEIAQVRGMLDEP